MAGPGPGLAQLPGREQECAVVGRLLVGARAGAGGALVVRGEPGIGKSALLGYARQHAPPMMVLSACGVQAESDLAFAGLHEPLRPVLGYLGERILIVDDHEVSRAALRALLRTEGIDVVDVGTGDTAITAAIAFHPDVVIVDVAPADPAGFLIAGQLQALPDAPPVVLTSSSSRRWFGSQLGRHVFVAKADLCARAIEERATPCPRWSSGQFRLAGER